MATRLELHLLHHTNGRLGYFITQESPFQPVCLGAPSGGVEALRLDASVCIIRDNVEVPTIKSDALKCSEDPCK